MQHLPRPLLEPALAHIRELLNDFQDDSSALFRKRSLSKLGAELLNRLGERLEVVRLFHG